MLAQSHITGFRHRVHTLSTRGVGLGGHPLELQGEIAESQILQDRVSDPLLVADLLRIEKLLQREAPLHLGIVATGVSHVGDEDGSHAEGSQHALDVVLPVLDEAHVALSDLAQLLDGRTSSGRKRDDSHPLLLPTGASQSIAYALDGGLRNHEPNTPPVLDLLALDEDDRRGNSTTVEEGDVELGRELVGKVLQRKTGVAREAVIPRFRGVEAEGEDFVASALAR